MRYSVFQIPGKPGGGVSSHILGGVTRRENLPTDEIKPIGQNSADKSKDKRFSSAKAPTKGMFSGRLEDIGKL